MHCGGMGRGRLVCYTRSMQSSITSRAFSGADDLRRAADFILALGGPVAGHWHIGDFWWKLYQNEVFDPARDLRLWEDPQGRLLALAWFEEYDGVDWQLHPELERDASQRDRIQDEILGWGAAHPERRVGEDGPELWTWALDEGDEERIAFLTGRGFKPDAFHMLQMCCDLSRPKREAPLPDGWTVRHVGGEQEWEERVEAHREVWHPSRVTLAAYRCLRACAGYTPELDLIAVSPEADTFGAYALVWHDPANRTGEFEPVGTRPAYRRMGLGRAVIIEGLRRLRDRGCDAAVVYSVHDNEVSTKLYESAGFSTFNRARLYGKKL